MNIEKIKNKIIHGNSLDILKKIPENSVIIAVYIFVPKIKLLF